MINKNINRLVVGQVATNCWIYQVGANEAAVIDPGDEAQTIISALKKLSFTPKYILLTHGHFDHILAVPQLKEVYKESQIAIHRLDKEYFGAGAYKAHSISIKAATGSSSLIDALWRELPEPDLLLDEGDTIGPLTVLHVPGHTHGSVVFWDREAGVVFTGDTLFRNGFGRTDLPGGDDAEMTASLQRLFAMDGNIAVYPGHGGETTIGREAG